MQERALTSTMLQRLFDEAQAASDEAAKHLLPDRGGVAYRQVADEAWAMFNSAMAMYEGRDAWVPTPGASQVEPEREPPQRCADAELYAGEGNLSRHFGNHGST